MKKYTAEDIVMNLVCNGGDWKPFRRRARATLSRRMR